MPEARTAELDKKRNSGSSRSALLEAAAELFASQGYEQTTVREIGRVANVDPTLIARYFGSKAALYLESLRGQGADGPPVNLRDAEAVRDLLDRVAPRGPSPTLYAAVRPHEDPELQAAAMEFLGRRVTRPVEAQVRAAGLDQAELRAEVATAALAGIMLSRTAKALPALTQAASSEVAELVAALMTSLTGS